MSLADPSIELEGDVGAGGKGRPDRAPPPEGRAARVRPAGYRSGMTDSQSAVAAQFPADVPDQPELVSVQREGDLVRLTIERPEVMNCLSFPTLKRFRTVLAELREDLSIRCILIAGAGERAFCAGADLKENIIIVSGIFREQKDLEFVFDRFSFSLSGFQLFCRHLTHVRIAVFLHLQRRFDRFLIRLKALEASHHWANFSILTRQLTKLGLIINDLRRGQERFQLLMTFSQVVEFE